MGKKRKKPTPRIEDGRKIVARNRRARHFHHIEDTVEAGLALVGTEVKSLRQGAVTLKDGYAAHRTEELFLFGVHITPYTHGTHENHDPERPRKLLLHRRQIRRLIGYVAERGYTLLPLEIYFNERGKAKVLLGLARGKKHFDRREDVKKREAEREIERALRRRR